MTSELSVHDNQVLGHEVDAARRRIVIHTRYADPKTAEDTDILFEGVFAYAFEQDNFQSIVFDLEDSTVERVVDDHRALFERGQKHGWPGTWNRSRQACLDYLQAHDARAFELSSSFGLCGDRLPT